MSIVAPRVRSGRYRRQPNQRFGPAMRACSSVVKRRIRIAEAGVRFSPGPQIT